MDASMTTLTIWCLFIWCVLTATENNLPLCTRFFILKSCLCFKVIYGNNLNKIRSFSESHFPLTHSSSPPLPCCRSCPGLDTDKVDIRGEL